MKNWFKIFTIVVNFGLFLCAMWFGLFKAEYAHASFLLLLLIINERNITGEK